MIKKVKARNWIAVHAKFRKSWVQENKRKKCERKKKDKKKIDDDFDY
jgi:hypothetical protein